MLMSSSCLFQNIVTFIFHSCGEPRHSDYEGQLPVRGFITRGFERNKHPFQRLARPYLLLTKLNFEICERDIITNSEVDIKYEQNEN